MSAGLAGARGSGPLAPGRERGGRGLGLVLVGAAFAVGLALPVVTLLVRAVTGGQLTAVLQGAALLEALTVSLTSTAISLLLTLLLGTPLAWALARRRLPAAGLVETIVDLPLVLPPAVAGLALLLLLGRRGWLGDPLAAAGLTVPFTFAAVVLAQLFVSAPLYVRVARTGFAAVPEEVLEAARVDGATEAGLFRHLLVPLAAGALASGAATAWVRALGEFGATILFAGNVPGQTQTLPLLVYAAFQGDLDVAIAAAAVLVLVALAFLGLVRLRGGRAVIWGS